MKTVLIVDDETSFLLSLRDGLKKHSDQFSILTAGNGNAAVTILERVSIDLLVTDIKMPEMDGFELLAWVSRKRPKIPVVVMTAFGTPEIESRLRKHETIQYLEKPLDLKTFEKAIINGLSIKEKSFIRGISSATFLQLIHLEKKSCTLKVNSDGKTGYLYLQHGELIDATCGYARGEKAAYTIINWESTEIEMDNVCRRQTGPINSSIEAILLESCRLKDEQEANVSSVKVQAKEHPVLDDLEIPEELGDLTGHMIEVKRPRIPERAAPKQQRTPQRAPSKHSRKHLMELIDANRDIDEYALFDSQGFLEKKNSGKCSLREFDPAIYQDLAGSLTDKFDFGICNWISFTTSDRCHFLLFNLVSHNLLIKLKKTAQAKSVAEEIKSTINTLAAF